MQFKYSHTNSCNRSSSMPKTSEKILHEKDRDRKHEEKRRENHRAKSKWTKIIKMNGMKEKEERGDSE